MSASRRGVPGDVLPGVLVLDHDLRLRSQTSAGRDWLAELFPAGWTGALPPAVAAVAASLLGSQSSIDLPPLVRVVCQVGPQRWAVLHCARLEGDAAGLAVIIDQPRPGEVRELLCQTWGLSPRERALFDLVVQGLATAEMAERLGIRPHTVQDHLEAIFAKVGVRSRRELTSRLLAALQA